VAARAKHILTFLDTPERWGTPPPGTSAPPSPAETARQLARLARGEEEDVTVALSRLMLAGHVTARWEYWSALRAGRYHWINAHGNDLHGLTLGWDPATFPHWIEDLDSNCCRVSGEVAGIFEHLVDAADAYSVPTSGVGEPRSRFVRVELERLGGAFVWAPVFPTWGSEDASPPDGRYVGVDDPTPP
jgi:hypothetical protein